MSAAKSKAHPIAGNEAGHQVRGRWLSGLAVPSPGMEEESVKYKVSELEGVLLDAAVAKAEGLRDADGWWARANGTYIGKLDYEPSGDWAFGGPIIERERMELRCRSNVHQKDMGGWGASIGPRGPYGFGPTPLIAAMRAYVASEFGEEVEL